MSGLAVSKTYKTDKSLQVKAGSGVIAEKALERGREAMEKEEFDFAPEAVIFLGQLESAIENVHSNKISDEQKHQAMIDPVMQIKANAGTFGYQLVGRLATIMLDFLEKISKIDKTALQIVNAHHKTMSLLISKNMRGDGGEMGPVLESELQMACKRYLKQGKPD